MSKSSVRENILRKPLNKTGISKHVKNGKKRMGRYPEIFIGLALILGGIAFSFFIAGSDGKGGTEVLVLAKPIRKDEVLKTEQLSTVKVQVEDSIGLLSANFATAVVGQKALLDLPARTPILTGHFSSSKASTIGDGYVLAGLKLKVGEYPTTDLTAGDRVDIFSMAQNSLSGLEVYSVFSLGKGEGADLFVTLIIPEFAEQTFVNLVQDGKVRLFINPTPIL